MIKYKKLTKEQIIISLDRLTRFKNPKDKYMRVFSDIILSNLIEPKLKKADLDKLEVELIKDYAVEILNSSISEYFLKTPNFSINSKLKEYEESIFECDLETTEFLNNKINYSSVFDLIKDSNIINLRWLMSLSSSENLKQSREKLALRFPAEKVLLVEGLTEETLLPEFSKFLGYDFDKKGIQIIPAGGKNQVVKLYYQLSQELKIPIFLLLDKDAEDNLRQIKPRLRKIDRIHLVSCGEFEDLLPDSLIIKTVNNHLNNFASITTMDFDHSLSNVKNLENIFKQKGLHEFKKAEFAKLTEKNINSDSDISEEIKTIIHELI